MEICHVSKLTNRKCVKDYKEHKKKGYEFKMKALALFLLSLKKYFTQKNELKISP